MGEQYYPAEDKNSFQPFPQKVLEAIIHTKRLIFPALCVIMFMLTVCGTVSALQITAAIVTHKKEQDMIKAIFLDYTGTMVMDDEPYTRELMKYFITHSELKDPKEILRIVWGMIKKLEYERKGEDFIRNDQRIDLILEYCVQNCGLKGDLAIMHEMWQKIWVYAPLFDDVKPFMEGCGLPVYVLSNDDLVYLERSMADKGLRPAGIISAEMSRACKPHREIFEKAMEIAGVRPEEVIHIGDSVVSDVQAAKAVGITPVLIDRSGKEHSDEYRVIRSLSGLEL